MFIGDEELRSCFSENIHRTVLAVSVTDSLEKTLMLGGIRGRRRRG